MTNFATVTSWLHVGDLTSCDATKKRPTIHIWRSDYEPRCSCFQDFGSIDLDYRDGEGITKEMFEKIDGFIEAFRKIKFRESVVPILIHCHAGACRSPIIAAYVLSKIDDWDIFDSIAIVSKAIWKDRQLAVNITHRPLMSILHHERRT